MRRERAWLKLVTLGLLATGCAQTQTVAVPVAEADLLKMRSRLDGKSGAVYSGGKPATTGGPATRRELMAGTVYVEPFAVRVVDGGSERSIPRTPR